MMLRLHFLELCLLIGGQHLVNFLATFLLRILDNLFDGRFLIIGQIKLCKTRRQMGLMLTRRRWWRSVIIGPRRLQAQERSGTKAQETKTNGCFHYH